MALVIWLSLSCAWLALGRNLVLTRAEKRKGSMDDAFTFHFFVRDLPKELSNTGEWLKFVKDPGTAIIFLAFFISLPAIRLSTLWALAFSSSWIKTADLYSIHKEYSFWQFNCHGEFKVKPVATTKVSSKLPGIPDLRFTDAEFEELKGLGNSGHRGLLK